MKHIFIAVLCISFFVNANAQVNPSKDSTKTKIEAKPEFEMKQYWVCNAYERPKQKP